MYGIMCSRFGSLVVMEPNDIDLSDSPKGHWLCRCDCGDSVVVHQEDLFSGEVDHCGCLWQDRFIDRRSK